MHFLEFPRAARQQSLQRWHDTVAAATAAQAAAGAVKPRSLSTPLPVSKGVSLVPFALVIDARGPHHFPHLPVASASA